ncbi:MAG TPA: hypothetical protein VGL83_19530 [Stellaceae bacterium]|jgi:hypothetical protein
MARLMLLAALSVLLAACDSYYGGAPGYAVNERPTLAQLGFDTGDRDNSFAAMPRRPPQGSLAVEEVSAAP